jgi:hypothetical protein
VEENERDFEVKREDCLTGKAKLAAAAQKKQEWGLKMRNDE